MEKELQLQLAQILGLIKDGINTTKDFALEQLPDIALQYILFNRVYLSFVILTCTLFILFVAKVVHKYESSAYDSTQGQGIVVGLCIAVIPIIILLVNLKNFFLVWAAPKLFLLQGITTLITK